jgi:hypothetical protein
MRRYLLCCISPLFLLICHSRHVGPIDDRAPGNLVPRPTGVPSGRFAFPAHGRRLTGYWRRDLNARPARRGRHRGLNDLSCHIDGALALQSGQNRFVNFGGVVPDALIQGRLVVEGNLSRGAPLREIQAKGSKTGYPGATGYAPGERSGSLESVGQGGGGSGM